MFETRKWHLEKHDPSDTLLGYFASYDLIESNPKYHLYYDYVVRGTLIRLEDSKILWRGICNAELDFEMENGPVPSRLQITENSPPLTKARDLLATRCGKELLKKFLGTAGTSHSPRCYTPTAFSSPPSNPSPPWPSAAPHPSLVPAQ